MRPPREWCAQGSRLCRPGAPRLQHQSLKHPANRPPRITDARVGQANPAWLIDGDRVEADPLALEWPGQRNGEVRIDRALQSMIERGAHAAPGVRPTSTRSSGEGD